MLYDIVCRQAGSLAKAILEGVMNSGDAGASQCRIAIMPAHVIIMDNGEGITDRQQIDDWFATFGQPHDEEEAKTWGTFRMGRGQMFSFGVNKWKTGNFRMNVDFKNCPEDEAGFDLEEVDEYHDGCTIRIALYEELAPSELAETERLVTQWCKYAPFDVYLNDDLISVDVEEVDWDHVTDEAYIKLTKTGVLSIYNLGIWTMDWARHRLGTSGEVVSRQQLKVNFARNDIQSDCPVWRKVKPFLNRQATNENLKTKALDDDARQRLADQMVRGELGWGDVQDKRLITAVNGRQYAVSHLCKSWGTSGRISNAPKGDVLGDKLFQAGVAFIVADETLDRFGVDNVPKLLDKIEEVFDRNHTYDMYRMDYVPFETLTKGMDSTYVPIDEKQLRPTELVWLRLLEYHKYSLRLAKEVYKYANLPGSPRQRRIMIGQGPADGWTDGRTYVVIGRDFLAAQDFSVKGFNAVGNLLLHEFCHDDLDTGTHVHSFEFYQKFHDCSDSIGLFVDDCVNTLPKFMQHIEKKLTKRQLRGQDKLVASQKAAANFDERVAARK